MIKRALSGVISLFLIFGNASYIQADTSTNFCDGRDIIAAYFNGVWNIFQDAKESRDYFKKFYGSKTENGDNITYEALYNTTAGAFDDLMELFEQKIVNLNMGEGKLSKTIGFYFGKR